jgi:transaldolase
MNPLKTLHSLGQSVWYDYIDRKLVHSGTLHRLIERDGLSGVTSNPAIFEKAINGSAEYDEPLRTLRAARPGESSEELFYHLAIDDIRAAADALRPVYESNNGRDGFVSLEVSPELAHDTDATIVQARRLFQRAERPNLMIKVPATHAGLPAVATLISEGINVNVTLLFSVARYEEVVDAFFRGLESRRAQELPIDRVASVASFFVSRLDTKVDEILNSRIHTVSPERRPIFTELLGQAAVANAKLAYQSYRRLFTSERFSALQAAGAQPQRLLWGSTGTKNPDYSDVLYVETLVGPGTVNTMPPATYEAFRDHGKAELSIERDIDEAARTLSRLDAHGIDIDVATQELETEGVAQFAAAFRTLINAISAKVEEFTPAGTKRA